MRHNPELFHRLAKALGRNEPWLQESDEEMLGAVLDSGHPWLEGITWERLWNDGHARLNQPEDWRPFANGGFPTASGKAQLYPPELGAPGLDALPSAGAIQRPQGLQLISGKTLHFLNSGYNSPDRHRKGKAC